MAELGARNKPGGKATYGMQTSPLRRNPPHRQSEEAHFRMAGVPEEMGRLR